MTQKEVEIKETEIPRRSFLRFAIRLLNGLMACLLAVPGIGYLLTPVFRKGSSTWVKLGPVENFVDAIPQKAVFTYISESGYTRTEKNGFVWVSTNRKGTGEPTVLSAVCSHTGCNVAWQPDEAKFVCPCHGGRYNDLGEVLSGPPPRPLTKLPTRIENGQLFVLLTA